MMLRKKKMPMPVNLNDCCLLYQMGYRVEINDGRVIAVAREKRKRKNGLKAALIPTPLYHRCSGVSRTGVVKMTCWDCAFRQTDEYDGTVFCVENGLRIISDIQGYGVTVPCEKLITRGGN